MSKKAELHIRGLKEPISIDADIASAVSAMLKNATIDGNTPVDFPGIWSGSKKDIKYVMFPKNPHEDAWARKIEPMSGAEATAFEKKIKPYMLKANGYGFGEYHWSIFYMHAMKAITIDIFVDKNNREHLVPYVLDIFLYPKIQDEIESYMLYLSRKNYAIQMTAQEYDNMSKTLVGHL